MYQISKRLTMAGAFLSLACGFLLTQQPTKAATTSQKATPTTQVVKTDSNVIKQGVDGTCKWDIVKDGDEVVLTIHAGQLDPGNLAWKISSDFSNEVTKIVIDPDVIAPKDSSHLFANFRNVKEFVGLSNLNTSQVTNMQGMFYASDAKELDLNGWNTSNVTDMSSMFSECEKLEKVNVKSFNTENVTNMADMFFYCHHLHILDLSNFKTPKLETAYLMFIQCPLYYLDIRNFGNSKFNDYGMFEASFVCKLTVGPNLTNEYFPQPLEAFVFDDNGIKKVVTGGYWTALNGPDKGVKKAPWEMKYVKRDQPVTYIIENKPLINPYIEYKTITRTINLHLPSDFYNNEIVSFKQEAKIHRQVTINDDETKTYGEWSKDYWDEYNAPVISVTNGYSPKPAKVAKQIVDGNTQDQTVDIYY